MPRCKRCRRPLADPESISSGYGPVCRQRQSEDNQTILEFDKPSNLFKPGMSMLEQYREVKKVCGGSK